MNNWHDDDWTLTPEDGATMPERTWEPLAPRDDAAALFGRDYADWLADAQARAREDRYAERLAADAMRRALAREDREEEAALYRMLEEAEARWRR
jgi:hypothetical protein